MKALAKTGDTKAHGRWGILGITLAPVFCLLSLVAPMTALGQYTAPYVGLTGTLSSSNGMPASGYILTLVPSQPMYVGGTSIVVSNANCGTDSNGAIVGTPNPVGPAVLAANPGTGTLAAANYYVEITWYDAFGHQTLASPERMIQLTSVGNIAVSPPVAGASLSAVGMNVYIGTSSGAETYQGQVTNPASTYTQSAPLVTGAALPVFNNTVCVTVANDAAWPIGGYELNFTTPAGNNVPGYPQQVQFIGPGSAFNLSNGLPLWNGRVTFPVPIITLPYNHNAQSISGPVSFVGYNIYSIGHVGVGTALPAWGIDVEGTGAAAAVNANQGYLVNGAAGTVGQGLCSDGTYFDQACSFLTSLPTFYYQTVQAAGTDQTQRAKLNFSALFLITDSSSPARTNVGLAVTGNGGLLATATTFGVPGNCAEWDATGNVGDAGQPCVVGTSSATTNGYIIIPATPHNIIMEWGDLGSLNDDALTTASLPLNFPNACLSATASEDEANTAARPGNPRTIAASCSTTQILLWSSGSGSQAHWSAVGW